jgi:hypothetical protein
VLQNVLFIWSARHPTLSYRQGMDEILAILLFVIEQDTQFAHAYQETFCGSSSSFSRDSTYSAQRADVAALIELTSASQHEADVFAMFDRLMRHLEPFYAEESGTEHSLVLDACERVQNIRLADVDAELARVVESFEIEPQFYCLRWLRLMFSREFDMTPLLVLWDWLLASAALPSTALCGGDECLGSPDAERFEGRSIRDSLELVATAVLLSNSERLRKADWLVRNGGIEAGRENAIVTLMQGRPSWSVPELVMCADALPIDPPSGSTEATGMIAAVANESALVATSALAEFGQWINSFSWSQDEFEIPSQKGRVL